MKSGLDKGIYSREGICCRACALERFSQSRMRENDNVGGQEPCHDEYLAMSKAARAKQRETNYGPLFAVFSQ
jgi:hypothetical protein